MRITTREHGSYVVSARSQLGAAQRMSYAPMLVMDRTASTATEKLKSSELFRTKDLHTDCAHATQYLQKL